MGRSDPDTEALELLQEVGEQSLGRQLEAWHRVEEKVWRHAALLGLLLGAFAISLPTALETIRTNDGLVACLFLVSYFGLALDGLLGLFCFAMAMGWEVLVTDPMHEGFVEEYAEKDYDRVLVALAKSAEDSVQHNLDKFRKREDWALAGWRTVVVAPWLVGLSLIFYATMTL